MLLACARKRVTHVLTACVLCCRSPAAAIAIAIAAIIIARAAAARRQSAAAAIVIAIAATATAIATTAPQPSQLFHLNFLLYMSLFEYTSVLFSSVCSWSESVVVPRVFLRVCGARASLLESGRGLYAP